MCGRFTMAIDSEDLRTQLALGQMPLDWEKRYNIAPSQDVPTVPFAQSRDVVWMKWGLVPFWAKDPSIGYKMINARAETVAEKPSYRSSFKNKRCLILADGFYEWQEIPGSKGKQPIFIHLQDGKPFAFAGLWELWHAPDASLVYSCTIITTQPNALVQPIHNRMPVILPASAYATWLDPAERQPTDLNQLLVPYPADAMAAYPVSRLVNAPQNDTPANILPL